MTPYPNFPAFCSARTCGAPVIWTTTKNGKHRPVDRDPHPEGNIVLGDVLEDGTRAETVLTKAERAGWQDGDGDRHMPHHATCPDAERFRRK